MKTLRDARRRDDLVESFLESDEIGELCRNGKPVFYAFLNDGTQVEGRTRLHVACKLAQDALS